MSSGQHLGQVHFQLSLRFRGRQKKAYLSRIYASLMPRVEILDTHIDIPISAKPARHDIVDMALPQL